jgi:hypothetical protein
MKALAWAGASSLSTPMTRIFASAPPAFSCARTAAAKGGSSWWQLGHQFPKKSSTAGVPLEPPSAGTATWEAPVGPRFWRLKVGTGPPVRGAGVALGLVPRLVVNPTMRMIRTPMPRPMRMKRLRGRRTTGAAASPPLTSPGGGTAGGGASVMPAGP